MKQHQSLKKILATLILIILALCFFYYLLFKDIKLRNKHTSELQNNIELQIRRDKYMSSVELAVQNDRANIEKISNSIIGQDDDVTFIELLENTAKNNGLDIVINTLVIEDNSSFSTTDMTTLKIRAKTNGPWSGTYLFLNELELLPFNIRVEKLSLTNGSSNTAEFKNTATSSAPWQSDFEIRVLKYK